NLFFILRRLLALKTAVVTYIVSGGLYNPEPVRPGLVRNVHEADMVFGNCQYLSELLRQRLEVNAGVRYDGIDRRYFFSSQEHPPEKPSLTVLFAGSLRPYKRVDV